jgi:hypothetical protein
METLLKVGRLCFAISIAFFGAQYLLYGRFEGGLPLVPPWTPGAPALAYVLGAALVLSALSIATLWNAMERALFRNFPGYSATAVFPVLAQPSCLFDSPQWHGPHPRL